MRIESLLHSRERAYNNAVDREELDGHGSDQPRRKRKKHRVVIHTSPFLRCVQTSVGIAAGIAQYERPPDVYSRPGTGKARTPAHLHSASPRIRGADGSLSPSLAPISEPKNDFAHDLARRALDRRHRRARLRVDPFLGEWLNPSYFEDITPPPPSAMMVTTAKAELLHNENIDIFTPVVSNKSSNSSLWTSAHSRTISREMTLDDTLAEGMDLLAVPMSKRDRASSSSVSSGDSGSGPRSPFRAGHVLHPFISTVPKPEPALYHPPVPAYALAGSDHIPRGYVAHARNLCANIDIHWDSSHEPVNWGDGGEYGEEWSQMQRRFRRGLNNMIEWYSKHPATEDPFEEGETPHRDVVPLEDDVEEDLVVVLVTHAAGCNALIGALTSQPVLMDVGMASLTVALRRDDAPPLHPVTPSNSPDPLLNNVRRPSMASMDIGLSSIYEMKMISSSEHLRPGTNPSRSPDPTSTPRDVNARPQRGGSGFESISDLSIPSRNSTSTSLGSIRRPSLGAIGSVSSAPDTRGSSPAFKPRAPPPGPLPTVSHPAAPSPSMQQPPIQFVDSLALPSPTFSPGLWTPPASRLTPQLAAQRIRDDKDTPLFTPLSEALGAVGATTPSREMVLDFSNAPAHTGTGGSTEAESSVEAPPEVSVVPAEDAKKHDSLLEERAPPRQVRVVSPAGLWGSSRPVDIVPRSMLSESKRRWTLTGEQHSPS